MKRRSVAKAILEAVDDKERGDEEKERDELDMAGPSDIDKVVKDEPGEDPPFAPDANMTIKDQEVGDPSVPGGEVEEPPVPGGEVEEPSVPGGEVTPEADPRVEALADASHAAWSGWMEHLFGKSTDNEDGSVTIPAEQVERWKRQVATPYAELSDEEKESDREEARKYVAALEGPKEPSAEGSSEPVSPVEAPEEEPPWVGRRDPHHPLDPHDQEGEGDGW
jgi:hypothetical protein